MSNPLRTGLRTEHKPEPLILVIFGGSGDLTRRKLMPSLCQLATRDFLPDKFAIVSMAQTKRTREEYQAKMVESIKTYSTRSVSPEIQRRIEDLLYYISADFADEAGYAELKSCLDKLSEERHTEGNVIFYLATPPSTFPLIISHLEKAGLSKGKGWRRIVVEKPFGSDLKSAMELNSLVTRVFPESDVYRIDHYLGKETVQNVLMLRFANAIFEPIWNRRYVDHVQITAAEIVGVEGRGDYYEEAGALRDMVQNHMLQLLSLIAMESPSSFEANAVRDEKSKILRAIRRVTPGDANQFTVRGQYSPGLIDGRQVPGYRQESSVSATSHTETYIAAKFFVDNWRWQDVPFYARTGKRLARKKSEIAVYFKPVPHAVFGSSPREYPSPNVLVIRVQPNEGVSLTIETKMPGASVRMRSVNLDFSYLYAFGIAPSEAYEKLLLDCMIGDQTLFAREDSVEASWEVVTPIEEGWAVSPPPSFPNYAAGSLGPQAADELLERDGRRWRRL